MPTVQRARELESPEARSRSTDACVSGVRRLGVGRCVACLYANDSTSRMRASELPRATRTRADECRRRVPVRSSYTGAADSCSACGEGSRKASPGAEACWDAQQTPRQRGVDLRERLRVPGGQGAGERPSVLVSVGEYKQATGAGDCIDCGTGATRSSRSDDPSSACLMQVTPARRGDHLPSVVLDSTSRAPARGVHHLLRASTTSGTGSTSIDACSCVQPASPTTPTARTSATVEPGTTGTARRACSVKPTRSVWGDTSTAVQTACSTVDASVSPAGSDATCVATSASSEATCEACAAGSYSDQVDSASSANCGAPQHLRHLVRLPHQPGNGSYRR